MSEVGQRLVLAFDFGTRRIGVAVGNELVGRARELEPLPARDGIPTGTSLRGWWRWQPALFVVGLPLHADGTRVGDEPARAQVRQAAVRPLRRSCEWVDEHGSTREAKSIARGQAPRQLPRPGSTASPRCSFWKAGSLAARVAVTSLTGSGTISPLGRRLRTHQFVEFGDGSGGEIQVVDMPGAADQAALGVCRTVASRAANKAASACGS
ncbi:pre-16S rRNA-processing nuclease YqgF [Billgrantia gudaonensis]|uniref:Pre-16S rRNA-processing nuclease YqgF n=1 Tax=Billgrantia gudaonensis TaxID=376427 RepID=A0A3S0NXB4_9GAMM|nr:pre-16S rRNA-processing nuclease YqgF [Halomonas gudaonensis]